ncbi:MAG: rhodanese-like domain-containing protein, partial [Geminicoccaceae bacterium]|nr:rhodanese-like domain-containing protein [Geminicoccaceae bacterium]
MSALVTTDWLVARLGAPDVRPVDATWVMPDSGRDPRAEYEAAHIPGAVYFDIDEICDEASPYPHMVPSAAKFSAKVRKLGLGDGITVVVYDANRFCASARVWWMFRLFGHEAVVVLDGGMERWRAEGRPLE